MASSAPGPLTEADYTEMVKRLKDLDAAELQIEKGIQAGLPLQSQRDQARQLREQLTRIRQTYFPGR